MSELILPGAALILDRDDTLVVDSGYMSGDHPIIFVPGMIALVVAAAAKGIPLFIATNQSGIARGYYSLADMHHFNTRLRRRLEEQDVHIVDVVFCPHGPDEGCLCRKPRPGMLHQLRDLHGIVLENSVVVGDKPSDEQLGKLHCRNGFRINKNGFSHDVVKEILAAFS